MDMLNRRIVLVGKTGVGKSSLANTIFGEELVKVGHTVNSLTQRCQAKTKTVNGRNITLIDTPGFFDPDRSEEEQKSEIVRCIAEFAPGPHAFLIVFKVERYTDNEQAVITHLNQYFSEEVFQYAIVLFTHGDQIPEGQTIKDFFHDNELVSDLVKKCGGRCHVIDNKYWKNNQQEEYRSNQFQVKELLKTIDKMVEANEGRCYTNEMLQAVEGKIKQEMQLIINLAGITTGVLIGALFGVVAMFRVVVSALEAVLPVVSSAACEKAARTVAAALTTETGGAVAAALTAGTGGAVAAALTAETGGAAEIRKSLIALTVTSAVVGAVAGGVAGYYAAEGAATLLKAAERAAKVVIDGSKTTVDAVKYCLRK